MFKELLESLGLNKDLRIVCYTICVTSIAMYFIGDHVFFAERTAVLNQNKNELEGLKLIKLKDEKNLEEYRYLTTQNEQKIAVLSREITRLKTYELAIFDFKKALDEERAGSSLLREQIYQLNLSSKENKQIAESCAAEKVELRTNVSKLNGVISSYAPILDRRSEIVGIEKNKNSLEVKIAELESDPYYKQLYVQKVEQLKRLSSEYQQHLLQLRQCGK
jgi:hypothetical protein